MTLAFWMGGKKFYLFTTEPLCTHIYKFGANILVLYMWMSKWLYGGYTVAVLLGHQRLKRVAGVSQLFLTGVSGVRAWRGRACGGPRLYMHVRS